MFRSLQPHVFRGASLLSRSQSVGYSFATLPTQYSWPGPAQHANDHLELDPELIHYMKDIQMSLDRPHNLDNPRVIRELEATHSDPSLPDSDLEGQSTQDERRERKSPAAHFGSQGIGAVVLPFELQQTIGRLISGITLHSLNV